MYATTRWHSEGLRWIGSLFTAAADRLERASLSAPPFDQVPPEYRRDDERIDDVRQRILSRYF